MEYKEYGEISKLAGFFSFMNRVCYGGAGAFVIGMFYAGDEIGMFIIVAIIFAVMGYGFGKLAESIATKKYQEMTANTKNVSDIREIIKQKRAENAQKKEAENNNNKNNKNNNNNDNNNNNKLVWTCQKCGKINETGKFCSECGTQKKIERFCTNCGVKLQDGQKFCSECGQKVD